MRDKDYRGERQSAASSPLNKSEQQNMEDRIQKIIEEKIRPSLQMDGGDIEYLGMDGNNVKVRLKGACHGCPSAQITLQMGVLRLLKAEIPEIEGVIPC
jgi:Fe-S cluster biogenesis protein NfuA